VSEKAQKSENRGRKSENEGKKPQQQPKKISFSTVPNIRSIYSQEMQGRIPQKGSKRWGNVRFASRLGAGNS